MNVTWQWLMRSGSERFEMTRGADGWTLRGTIDCGAQATYEISCDSGWLTRAAHVEIVDDAGRRAIELTAANGRWRVDGAEAPHLDGCLDIDLGWSPSTNTLPIRRLNIPIGGRSGILTMAWVRFPQLTVEPMRQEYERIAERQYVYTSRDGSFRATVEVDGEGVVVDYEGIWRKVDPSS
jgi:hypothetical protein